MSFRNVLFALGPASSGEYLPAAIVAYIIGFLTLIALFMQQEGGTRDFIFLSVVILVCIVDKVAVTAPLAIPRDSIRGLEHNSFGIFLLRVAPFTLPFIVAGSTKSEKSRPLLIGVGFLGGAYLFFRWFFEIRPQ